MPHLHCKSVRAEPGSLFVYSITAPRQATAPRSAQLSLNSTGRAGLTLRSVWIRLTVVVAQNSVWAQVHRSDRNCCQNAVGTSQVAQFLERPAN